MARTKITPKRPQDLKHMRESNVDEAIRQAVEFILQEGIAGKSRRFVKKRLMQEDMLPLSFAPRVALALVGGEDVEMVKEGAGSIRKTRASAKSETKINTSASTTLPASPAPRSAPAPPRPKPGGFAPAARRRARTAANMSGEDDDDDDDDDDDEDDDDDDDDDEDDFLAKPAAPRPLRALDASTPSGMDEKATTTARKQQQQPPRHETNLAAKKEVKKAKLEEQQPEAGPKALSKEEEEPKPKVPRPEVLSLSPEEEKAALKGLQGVLLGGVSEAEPTVKAEDVIGMSRQAMLDIKRQLERARGDDKRTLVSVGGLSAQYFTELLPRWNHYRPGEIDQADEMLHDEVVGHFMALLVKDFADLNKKGLRTAAITTLDPVFASTLMGRTFKEYNFEAVARWGLKAKAKTADVVFFPVHVPAGPHFTHAIFSRPQNILFYLDPAKHANLFNTAVPSGLARYLVDAELATTMPKILVVRRRPIQPSGALTCGLYILAYPVLLTNKVEDPLNPEYSEVIDGSWRRKMASYVIARRVLGAAEEGAGEVSPFVFEDEQEEESEEENSDSEVEFVEERKSKRKREEE